MRTIVAASFIAALAASAVAVDLAAGSGNATLLNASVGPG
jgi:hypothetical protein